MNRDRLQMVIDAMEEGARKERVFNFSTVIDYDESSSCGVAGCAIGDLALYPPAQALGMRVAEIFGQVEPDVVFNGTVGFETIHWFLDVYDVDERDWVDLVFSSAEFHGQGCMRDVTRDMVAARIRAKIAEIDASNSGLVIPI